jgi:hypothetical protein
MKRTQYALIEHNLAEPNGEREENWRLTYSQPPA